MIARLLISSTHQNLLDEINKILNQAGLSNPHPDLLTFTFESKLGMPEARKIKEHFSLKPYSAKGRAVILEDATNLTPDAQNALLKTLEELPEEGIIILGASSDAKFLPTILSRCEIVILNSFQDLKEMPEQVRHDIEELLKSDIETRFEYIEKLKDRGEFLKFMVHYFHQQLPSHLTNNNTNFLKELLQAEQWAEANVNIRGILEYLMLVMPGK